jgi:hypothetical protein
VAVGKSRFVLFPGEELAFSVSDKANYTIGYEESGGMRRPWVQIRAEDGGVTDVLGKPEIGEPRPFG